MSQKKFLSLITTKILRPVSPPPRIEHKEAIMSREQANEYIQAALYSSNNKKLDFSIIGLLNVAYSIILFLLGVGVSLLIAGFLASFFAKAQAAVPLPDFSRALYLQGEVDMPMLGATSVLLDYTDATKVKADVAGKPVTVIIDSPGGSVDLGYLLIDVIEEVKARGVVVRCYVQHIAASMAFQILTHCSERYGLPGSLYLWHRVRMGAPSRYITAPLAADMLTGLAEIDQSLISELSASLPLSVERILFHMERETLHRGIRFSILLGDGGILGTPWLVTAPRIPGLLSIPAGVPRPDRQPSFMMRRVIGVDGKEAVIQVLAPTPASPGIQYIYDWKGADDVHQ